MALISPQADKKGIQLKLEEVGEAPTIRTDVKKFQQILFNFLSNAVKFTDPMERTGRQGIVTLRVERLPSSTPGSEGAPDELARVSVIDNGPGIPPEEHARVFEKFHQLDGGATKEHAGTGLGLAISRELAHILGGEIQLVSDVGKGSMFSLILPVHFDKGRLAEGNDADLTIVDLAAKRTLRHEDMATRSGWTPFDGMETTGWPMATIIRGRVVMRDDEIQGTAIGEPVRFLETLAS